MGEYKPSKITQYLNSTKLKMEKGLPFEEAVKKARVPKYCWPIIWYLLDEIEKGNLTV